MDNSITGHSTVQNYESTQRYAKLLKEEGKITTTFPGYVENAEKLNTEFETTIGDYNYNEVSENGVKQTKKTLDNGLKKVEKNAEAITGLLNKVSTEFETMSKVPELPKNIEEATTLIDKQLGKNLVKGFEAVKSNNQTMGKWETSLKELQNKITVQIETTKKYQPGFYDSLDGMVRAKALNEEYSNSSKGFGESVIDAERQYKLIKEEVNKYQYPAKEFKVETETLTQTQTKLHEGFETMKKNAQKIEDLRKKVVVELDKKVPELPKVTGAPESLDAKLNAKMLRVVEQTSKNISELKKVEENLKELHNKMIVQINDAEKWIPTFDNIVDNQGAPLTNFQWYGITSVKKEEQKKEEEAKN